MEFEDKNAELLRRLQEQEELKAKEESDRKMSFVPEAYDNMMQDIESVVPREVLAAEMPEVQESISREPASIEKANEDAKANSLKPAEELEKDKEPKKEDIRELRRNQSRFEKEQGQKDIEAELDPKLKYAQLMKKYEESLNKKDELGWQDYLPDALAGLHNIVNYAQGSLQPNLKLGSVDRARKAKQAEKDRRLSGLQKLQQMHQQYMKLGKDTESMTPYQKLNYELAKDRLEEKKEDRERKKQQFKQSMERRESEDFDKKVSDVSKRIEKSGLIERTRAMQDIENYLDAEYNANLDKPKDIDIGGMGVMGGLRPDFLTDEGDVSFRQNVQSLANQLLKVRSGAAVTDQEYRRFLKEVGSGNFSSEKDLMNGLKKMREDIKNQTANITKTYGKDVSKEYIDRTGVQLYKGGKSSDKVSVVLPDGRKGTIQRSKLDAFKKKYPDADILE